MAKGGIQPVGILPFSPRRFAAGNDDVCESKRLFAVPREQRHMRCIDAGIIRSPRARVRPSVICEGPREMLLFPCRVLFVFPAVLAAPRQESQDFITERVISSRSLLEANGDGQGFLRGAVAREDQALPMEEAAVFRPEGKTVDDDIVRRDGLLHCDQAIRESLVKPGSRGPRERISSLPQSEHPEKIGPVGAFQQICELLQGRVVFFRAVFRGVDAISEREDALQRFLRSVTVVPLFGLRQVTVRHNARVAFDGVIAPFPVPPAVPEPLQRPDIVDVLGELFLQLQYAFRKNDVRSIDGPGSIVCHGGLLVI